MKTIESYTIFEAYNDIQGLSLSVDEYTKMGWQPYGSLQVTPGSSAGSVRYTQAMVKYAHESNLLTETTR